MEPLPRLIAGVVNNSGVVFWRVSY